MAGSGKLEGSAGHKDPSGEYQIDIAGQTIARISATFADVAPAEPVAYWGSLGTLEIALREGNARERFGLHVDVPVRLCPARRA